MRLLMILALLLTALGCDHQVHEARAPIQPIHAVNLGAIPQHGSPLTAPNPGGDSGQDLVA